MINLPKPSLLRVKGSDKEQISYLVNYLNTLVTSIETIFTGSQSKIKSIDSGIVNGISVTNKGLVITYDNGEQQLIPSNKVLWQGALYMKDVHNISLSSNISKQLLGIVLVFSAFVDGVAKDYHFQSFFVPKIIVESMLGKGHNFPLCVSDFSFIGNKYLYISDKNITGHSINGDSGTKNGITYTNNHWVLRYVIGI